MIALMEAYDETYSTVLVVSSDNTRHIAYVPTFDRTTYADQELAAKGYRVRGRWSMTGDVASVLVEPVETQSVADRGVW